MVDMVAYERVGVPTGRIFVAREGGKDVGEDAGWEVTGMNRTFKRTFKQMLLDVDLTFPVYTDSLAVGARRGASCPEVEEVNSMEKSFDEGKKGSGGVGTVGIMRHGSQSPGGGGTDDSFNDVNYWRTPHQLII